MTGSDAKAAELFTERYRVGPTDVTRRIERAVIGGDWGANGYTTLAQAGKLGAELGLGPGVRLLDLGAGQGWPGLYLATATGCQVVLADVPTEGLRSAAARARAEGVAARAVPVSASARRLPFAAGTFDGVAHTDVLCCLRPKLSVLRASRRVLRPGGRTAFYTIHPAAGLAPAQRRRAARSGAPAVSTARPYEDLLAAAGFTQISRTDCTAEFAETAQAWLSEWDASFAALAAMYGEQAVAERQRKRRAQLRAINDGLLARSLFTATRP